jgi:hypothetical protein
MSKHHIASLLSLPLLLVLGNSAAAQTASSSRTAAEPGVVQRMQRAVVRGSEAATGLLNRATKADEPDARAAADRADREAKAEASEAQRRAKAAGSSSQPPATKAKAPSRAPPKPKK